ncbi:MAG: hypothetical protein KDD89_12670, partial [Anaerolineales bacterium]|nr:hypothetical protein [Anaerolineales bacterium]
SQLKPWEQNPRQSTQAQAKRILQSMADFGQVQTVAISPDGEVYDGHQRLSALLAVYGADYELDARQSSRPLTDYERRGLVLALHATAAGEWDWDALANWDLPSLLPDGFADDWLEQLNYDGAMVATMLAAEDDWASTDNGLAEKSPSARKLPIDVIYTLQMADCTCCLAVQAGFKYGIQSAQYNICPYEDRLSGRHKVTFIDNDYFNYDHETHLAAVKKFRPKYATVMDVITEAQAKKDGVKRAYPLEQILEWAEELEQYAENVIVIPKYDCLDRIPPKFMLGYSVPTSHGGTPLPPEMFKGRRVHLLGGSWKMQLAHMAVLGDDVVSIDNNHVLNISRFGQYVLPNGETSQLEPSGFGYLNNPRYVALALSFGAIGAKVNELYTAVEEPAEEN